MRQTTTASISIGAPPTTNLFLTCVTTVSEPAGLAEPGAPESLQDLCRAGTRRRPASCRTMGAARVQSFAQIFHATRNRFRTGAKVMNW